MKWKDVVLRTAMTLVPLVAAVGVSEAKSQKKQEKPKEISYQELIKLSEAKTEKICRNIVKGIPYDNPKNGRQVFCFNRHGNLNATPQPQVRGWQQVSSKEQAATRDAMAMLIRDNPLVRRIAENEKALQMCKTALSRGETTCKIMIQLPENLPPARDILTEEDRKL